MSKRIGRRRFLGLGATAFAATLAELRSGFAAELAGEAAAVRGSQGFAGLRDAYTLDPEITYFNHASIGTIPRLVQEARRRYQDLCESNPWLYVWGGAWEQAREGTRAKAARLLGCTADEVALTHNTTEGFNVLAQGLPLGRGDEVLFSSMNHAGASICWFHQAEARGFTVRRFDFPVARAAELAPADLVGLYSAQIRDRTRVLVFPHIDNIVGFRYPIRELASEARSRGVEFIAVDGAQSAGMIPFRLAEMDVDFYAASPHKWIQAPKELGLLYVRAGVRETLRPMWVTWGQDRWGGTVRIFEDYGTRNWPELVSLEDALDFQNELGADAKHERYRELWQHCRRRVAESEGLLWRSPVDWRFASALFAIEVEGRPSAALASELYEREGHVLRAFSTQGLNTLRVSPNVFNTVEQIDKFVDILGTQRDG